MKKILIINGHPYQKSLCASLAESYLQGAKEGNYEVKMIHLSQLKFDPILHKGYLEIQELEEDLKSVQQDILWAQHLVFVYPIWWGSVPALLKGFLDRVFLPGFAFKYHKGSPWWDRLLKGRTGRLIITTDAPWWWNKFMYSDPAIKMMKKAVLEFCGVSSVKVTQLDEIKNKAPKDIELNLKKVYDLGKRGV